MGEAKSKNRIYEKGKQEYIKLVKGKRLSPNVFWIVIIILSFVGILYFDFTSLGGAGSIFFIPLFSSLIVLMLRVMHEMGYVDGYESGFHDGYYERCESELPPLQTRKFE